ncbi:MAG: YdcF family protein [Bacilli bacterium]
MSIEKDLNLINEFLALRTFDKHTQYDVIIVLGSALASVALDAYKLYKEKYARYFVIAGGKGHTTQFLISQIETVVAIDNPEDKSEAFLLKQLIEDVYGKDDSILLEETSRNCGENIKNAMSLLQYKNINCEKVLLCHDPLMQRRIDATANKQFPHIKFDNQANFIPHVIKEANGNIVLEQTTWGLWGMDTYINLLIGEMKRVIDNSEGYGPTGKDFITHVDVSNEVLSAFKSVRNCYFQYDR